MFGIRTFESPLRACSTERQATINYLLKKQGIAVSPTYTVAHLVVNVEVEVDDDIPLVEFPEGAINRTSSDEQKTK